ncbi:MAG: hypothetical protein JW776_15715 [Candidatus Lokiarchaeota archaeon]|nr:hypothetical protein [Candidatus Lokiarchaeota archaeon]
MEQENPKNKPDSFWEFFLNQLAKKTRSRLGKSRKLTRAIFGVQERPKVYITLGVHGNILYSDIGYCEFDSPERVWKFIQKWADMAPVLPIGFEIGICSLENLAKFYPIWKLFQKKNVEIINPLYSQPYLRHLGEESNIRQLKFGLEILKQNDISCGVYSSSEHTLHPQLPQLLYGFRIKNVYATTRLGGGAPTSYLPKLYWKGLDGTTIKCIVNQSGIPNGQVWHGKFFQELASLLFLAFSRPDLSWVLYENIEDVAYDFPEIQEIYDHIEEFEHSNIHFRRFGDIFSNQCPFSRIISWKIEDFPLQFMYSQVISEVRKLEDYLINQEAISSLLSLLDFEIPSPSFEEIWKRLLTAQNHDAYIVPYVTHGLYLLSQGLSEINPSGLTIEEKSLQILNQAKTEIDEKTKFTPSLNQSYEEAYINWLWSREILDGDHLISLPSCGYAKTHSASYKSKTYPSKGNRSLNNLLAWIESPVLDGLNTSKYIRLEDYSVELEDHYIYQKLRICSKKDFELIISNCEELYITYPFGAQKTTETYGHSHRFYWINKKLVIVHFGCPYFTCNGEKLRIKVSRGDHLFGLGLASTLKMAYHLAWDFFFPPQKVMIPISSKDSQSLLRIKFNDFIPTSIRKRGSETILRGFCVGKSSPKVENGTFLDLNDIRQDGKIKQTNKSSKWKILSYLVND